MFARDSTLLGILVGCSQSFSMNHLETQLWFLWAASPLYPFDCSLNYEFELCSGPPLVCWVRPPQIVLNLFNVRKVVILHRAAPD